MLTKAINLRGSRARFLLSTSLHGTRILISFSVYKEPCDRFQRPSDIVLRNSGLLASIMILDTHTSWPMGPSFGNCSTPPTSLLDDYNTLRDHLDSE